MKPDYRVIVNGQDITPRLQQNPRSGDRTNRARLISLGLIEKRGEDADQLDLVIDDSDGAVALPPEGAKIEVSIGWRDAQGSRLTGKGSYIVDEVQHGGPPDAITIRAHAADFTSDLTERREQSWRDATIGAIVAEIAGRHGLTARCAPALAGKAVKDKAQSREGDLAFLRRLGREYDAVATIKDGNLILAPVGAGTSVTGKPLPTPTIRRSDADSHQFSIKKREEVTGVTAAWNDRKGAKRQTVTVGDKAKARRLSRTYASETEAKDAAAAANSRAARDPVELSLTLALGRADLAPEQKVKIEGFKPTINDHAWLIEQVQHSIGDRGFTTQVTLQTV